MDYAKSLEEFFAKQTQWEKELQFLRSVLLESELTETLKWGSPVYTWQNKNIAGIGAFKSYFGIWFFQGALLSDPQKLLINAQEGKTTAMRQMRFNTISDADPVLIRSYLNEAIKNQKAGREIKSQKNKPLIIPDILKSALDKHIELRTKFSSMSLSHQREYAEYISEAKREETKLRRLNKVISMILESKGLNDKYR